MPCAAHFLNLVGQSDVGCCKLAVNFFSFVECLYSFFVASTHRWKILTNQLSSQSRPTVKCMSDTRWSAHADATKALVEGYDEINTALCRLIIAVKYGMFSVKHSHNDFKNYKIELLFILNMNYTKYDQ